MDGASDGAAGAGDAERPDGPEAGQIQEVVIPEDERSIHRANPGVHAHVTAQRSVQ